MESIGHKADVDGEEADGELDGGVGDVEGEEERQAAHGAGGEPPEPEVGLVRGCAAMEGEGRGCGHGDGGVGAGEAGAGRGGEGELSGVGEAAVAAADDAVVGVPHLGIPHDSTAVAGDEHDNITDLPPRALALLFCSFSFFEGDLVLYCYCSTTTGPVTVVGEKGENSGQNSSTHAYNSQLLSQVLHKSTCGPTILPWSKPGA